MIDVGHAKLAYRCLGQGPDVLLIHGWPLYSATWRNVAPLIARHYRVHLLDLPGTGHSEWDDNSRISLLEHAESVRTAIDILGLESYALVAHNSGAVITRLVAADDPDRVTGLVISGSEIPETKSLLLRALFAVTGTQLGRKAMVVSMRSRMIRRSILGFGSCFHDVDKIDGAFTELFVQPMIESPAWVAGQMRVVDNFDWKVIDGLRSVHGRIQAPVLLLWGDNDPYFPADKAHSMIPQFGGEASMTILPNARLFPHEEYPEAFSEHTLRFLERCFG